MRRACPAAFAFGCPRSYGTATADGVRALLECGHDPASDRVRAAFGWLDRHAVNTVPGLLPEFEPSLRLYWAAALTLTNRALGRPISAHLPAALRKLVVSCQRADGSFLGLAGAMKEDDPVVATTLALTVLAGSG